MPSTESLTLFFPMWNEEEMIERTVAAGARGRRRADRPPGEIADFEVLSSTTRSTDATAAIADALADGRPAACGSCTTR